MQPDIQNRRFNAGFFMIRIRNAGYYAVYGVNLP